MIKLTNKWRHEVKVQLIRSRINPVGVAWVSPIIMIGSIQFETLHDDTIDSVSERVLHRVARIIRMTRPYANLYSAHELNGPTPPTRSQRASLEASVMCDPKTREQVVAEVLGQSNSQTRKQHEKTNS